MTGREKQGPLGSKKGERSREGRGSDNQQQQGRTFPRFP